ncbi:hypothetical protein [Vibrio penaeicida]|uniref:hypothetical protein n=1 Tax=Vibrio penaeicida TaxID=104609 RepID=UPI0021E177DE|nr:hypothetical protein [Vibrio penaeicida]
MSKYVGSRVETIQEFYDDYRLNNQQHIDQITLRDRNKERWDEYHRIMEEQKKLGVKVDDDMPNFLTEEEEEERIRLQVEAYNLSHPPENDVPPQPPEEW